MTAALGERIDAAVAGRRGTRVVALDDRAATLVRRLGREEWHAARFTTLILRDPRLGLHGTDGRRRSLSDELDGADVVVLVATAGAGDGDAAEHIGRACRRRRITVAAVVIGDQGTETVHALRPWARVLLTGSEPGDVGELLTALRA